MPPRAAFSKTLGCLKDSSWALSLVPAFSWGLRLFFSLLAEGFPEGKERRETHKRLGRAAVPRAELTLLLGAGFFHRAGASPVGTHQRACGVVGETRPAGGPIRPQVEARRSLQPWEEHVVCE